ncbi:WG repeat-containing protein, partial [Fretibacterium sp. OH1220_COT-178]|uniref:WG repeat-containing protein n=1 Tax=Fretibacterium sp. OH1220_COT-178 TaxID=2491047 RepID=UPI000FB7A038
VRDFSAKYVSPADVLSYFEGPGNLEGYVDLTGKVVVPPRYQSVSGIKDGFGVVKSGDLYGIIDEKGQTVLPIMYERFIYIFGANLFGVKSGDKWGYVNGRNEAITDFVFDEPSMWDDCPRGTCVAVLNGKSGLLDGRGRWVLPASYDAIYGVVRGEAEDNPRIGVCRDGKVGFVDLQGNTVIDFLFENPIRHVSGWTDCYQFSEGLASVLLSDSKPMEDVFGVIDETGKLLFRFSEAPRGAYREGYMVVEDEHENYSLIDRTGKLYPLPTWLEPIGVKEVVSGTLLVRVRQKVPWYEKGKFGYLSIPPQ